MVYCGKLYKKKVLEPARIFLVYNKGENGCFFLTAFLAEVLGNFGIRYGCGIVVFWGGGFRKKKFDLFTVWTTLVKGF